MRKVAMLVERGASEHWLGWNPRLLFRGVMFNQAKEELVESLMIEEGKHKARAARKIRRRLRECTTK